MCLPNVAIMSSEERYMYMDIILSLGSSPVQDLSVSRNSSTSLNISFTAPSAPNGDIDHYTVHVNNGLGTPPNFTVTVDSINTTDQYFTVPNILSK